MLSLPYINQPKSDGHDPLVVDWERRIRHICAAVLSSLLFEPSIKRKQQKLNPTHGTSLIKSIRTLENDQKKKKQEICRFDSGE